MVKVRKSCGVEMNYMIVLVGGGGYKKHKSVGT